MNKLFTYLIVFLASIILIKPAIGQSKFEPGYVITLSQDTINGLVDVRGDVRNGQVMNFKKEESEQPKEYLPKDIKGYSAANSIFHSIQFENNGVPQNAFFKVINDGLLKFYVWKDDSEKNRFFVRKGSELHELKNEPITSYKEGQEYISYTKEFIGFLNALTIDCGLSSNENMQFNQRAISSYVDKYNKCKQTNYYVASRKTATIKYSAFGGYNQTKVVASNDRRFSETDNQIGLTTGIGLHIIFPTINNKLTVDFPLQYSHKGGGYQEEYYTIKFDLRYIELVPGLTYTYSKYKVKPFVGAGLLFGYLLNKDSAYSRKYNKSETQLFPHEASGEIGYETRMGIKYEAVENKSFFINVKYGKSIIPNVSTGSTYFNNSLGFQIGYEF